MGEVEVGFSLFLVNCSLNQAGKMHAVGGGAHVSSDLLHELIQKHGFSLVVKNHDLSGKTCGDQSQGPLLNALVRHVVQSDVFNVATR